MVDPDELDPLDVTHDRDEHDGSLASSAGRRIEQMMNAVAISPSNASTRTTARRSTRTCASSQAATRPTTPSRKRSFGPFVGTKVSSTAATCARGPTGSRPGSRSTSARKRRPTAQLPELRADDGRPALRRARPPEHILQQPLSSASFIICCHPGNMTDMTEFREPVVSREAHAGWPRGAMGIRMG